MTVERGLRSPWFLLAYAMAHAGGVVAYLPLLSLLLPIKVAAVAGGDRMDVLNLIVAWGALAAAASNIVFGIASDRSVARGGTRRGWIALGLVTTAGGYAAIHRAGSAAELIAAMILWQVALNILLAPLFALMADEVPHVQKGVAGGLLTLASPVASLVSAVLVGAAMLGEGMRFAIVCGVVTLCVVPLLGTRAMPATIDRVAPPPVPIARRDLALAWVARLLVQVAGNVLFLYLLFYFDSIVGDADGGLAAAVGNLLVVAYVLPLPVAVAAGHWSDRIGRRRPFLIVSAAVAAAGLGAMALAGGWAAATAGFLAYAMGSAVFLGLHSGFVMQMIVRPERRGRILGIVNLTNTLPALIGAGLAHVLVPGGDFSALMGVLAAMTLAGGTATLAIRAR